MGGPEGVEPQWGTSFYSVILDLLDTTMQHWGRITQLDPPEWEHPSGTGTPF